MFLKTLKMLHNCTFKTESPPKKNPTPPQKKNRLVNVLSLHVFRVNGTVEQKV